LLDELSAPAGRAHRRLHLIDGATQVRRDPVDTPGDTIEPMSAPADGVFLRACRREPVEWTPVWFMRQAGRALPEYRAAREGVGMLEACLRPELVAELTTQPVRRYGVDAAILFSDIVVPLKVAGVALDIVPGVGPVVDAPVRSARDVAALPKLEPGDVGAVGDAVGLLVERLGSTPLIGFAGAPFTLASYLVEGGPSRDHLATKALMYGDEATWHRLAAALAEIAATFLRVQVDAGARAVQLFDSWAGTLSADDYARFVLPHSRAVLAAVPDVPRIHFGVMTGELLGLMADAGADVVGVDWRVPLDAAAARVGPRVAVQGNLDPAVLMAPWPVVADRAREVLRRGSAAAGHVFNLGHGVPPEADPDVLTRLVDLVHEESAS
jgi:uroporphyrinogen decarboxylase